MGNDQSRSEILFLGNKDGVLKEFKLKNYEGVELSWGCNCMDVPGNLLYNYDKVTDLEDFLMCLTSDHKFFIIACSKKIDKYNTVTKQVHCSYDLPENFGTVTSMDISHDEKYLFVSDNKVNLIQIDLQKKDENLINYGKVFETCQVHAEEMASSLAVTSKFVFISMTRGKLKQYSIQDQSVFRNWGKIFKSGIALICATKNEKYLFVASLTGDIRQFYMQYTKDSNIHMNKKLENTHKDMEITAMVIDYNDTYLFTADIKGNLKQWNIEEQELHSDWGNLSERFFSEVCVNSLKVTHDNKYLFVGGTRGLMHQYEISTKTLIKDHGKKMGSLAIKNIA